MTRAMCIVCFYRLTTTVPSIDVDFLLLEIGTFERPVLVSQICSNKSIKPEVSIELTVAHDHFVDNRGKQQKVLNAIQIRRNSLKDVERINSLVFGELKSYYT